MLGPPTRPFLICTIDEDESYSHALQAAVQGKQIASHPVRIRRLRKPANIPGCHLLLIGNEDNKRIATILAGIPDAPVLTVGEARDFATSGGIIGLSLQENKIRFDINLSAAQRANLKISARLLLLARNVIGGGKQG